MSPDTTHMMLYKYTNSTYESLEEARMTYNQDAKIHATLSHKPQGFGNLHSTATWLIQTEVYNSNIDSHGCRTQSEPLLSLILEDLHDGTTKTKYRYYMIPTNAKFISNMAWLRQYKANKIQPKFLALPTFPLTYKWMAEACTKIKPHAWPPFDSRPQK